MKCHRKGFLELLKFIAFGRKVLRYMLEKIKEILAKCLKIDASTINEDSDIVEDLGADSLDVVEIVMQIEEIFDITISDEDAKTLKTVGELSDYIEKNLKN